MCRTTALMQMLTSCLILNQIWDRFQLNKAEYLHKRLLNEKATLIGLMFRAKLNSRHKDHVHFMDIDASRK